jgi:hypothetical protein
MWTATFTKTQDRPLEGVYTPTKLDEEKKQVDFLIKDMGFIVWKDGRGERVTLARLKKLQSQHTCLTDF